LERFVLRDYFTIAEWISVYTILCIAKRFCNFMPVPRDQKLFAHLGEAGTAVFAVQEVNQGRHDLISLFDVEYVFQQGGIVWPILVHPSVRSHHKTAEWRPNRPEASCVGLP